MSISLFLKKHDVELSIKRYGVDALNFMALGLFSSLIVGLILKTIGQWGHLEWLIEVGKLAQSTMGAAIGVGVAYALKSPPLVLLCAVATGTAGNLLGGPVGCFIAVAISSEVGKIISKKTPVDIIATPAMTLIVGVAAAQFIGPAISSFMIYIGNMIMWAVQLQPFLMGMLVSMMMGILLTLPVSSAAIAISLSLSGLAAGAATVGCCAQMVGFAVMSFKENRWAGLLSQGLGTSMLQMPNIVKNPKIFLPPIITSAILGPIATLVFKMENIPSGAGMGTSGLVGQVGTIEKMGSSVSIFLIIFLLHFVAPAVITFLVSIWFRKKQWIKDGDLKLNS